MLSPAGGVGGGQDLRGETGAGVTMLPSLARKAQHPVLAAGRQILSLAQVESKSLTMKHLKQLQVCT